MVTILKHRDKPLDPAYRTTCRRCGCEFEFGKPEARYVSDQRDGDAVVIHCPECDEECWVNASLTI